MDVCTCQGRAGANPNCILHGSQQMFKAEPPNLRQREVAALEAIAKTLEAWFRHYEARP